MTDLAAAHIAALHYLHSGGTSDFFNLGSGKGYSVLEIIEASRRVTGHPIPTEVQPRREGVMLLSLLHRILLPWLYAQ